MKAIGDKIENEMPRIMGGLGMIRAAIAGKLAEGVAQTCGFYTQHHKHYRDLRKA